MDHRFASYEPRRPVDERVHRYPDERHEVPVDAVIVRVAEMLSFDRAKPEEGGEAPCLDGLEKEQRAVKCDGDPCRRCIRVRVPVRVEIPEVVDSKENRDCCKNGHDEETDPHTLLVEYANSLMQPVVGDIRQREKRNRNR